MEGEAQLWDMKFLFHVTHGSDWKDIPYEENLGCAQQLAKTYGGVAEEVILTIRDNRGEPDPPYATRISEEKAVVIETTLEGLAQWAADHDVVVQVLACTRWQESTVGRLTHRIYISAAANDEERDSGGSPWRS